MESAFLQIDIKPEYLPGTDQQKMRIQMKGNPVLLSMGICAGMEARTDIAAAMIAGVLEYCKRQNIDPRTIADMVKFHKK